MSTPRRLAVRRCGDPDQQPITSGVPKASVEDFELSISMNNTANLKSECRRETAMGRCKRSRKRARVGQTAQAAAEVLTSQFFLGALPLSDVTDHND